MTLASVRFVFPDAKRESGGYIALCPGHGEVAGTSTPSLFISWNAKPKKTLMVCRSHGCTPREIAKKAKFKNDAALFAALEGQRPGWTMPTKTLMIRRAKPRQRMSALDVDLDQFPPVSKGQLTALAEDRELPVKAFAPWEIRWNAKRHAYLFPVRTPDGTLVDLRRYALGDGVKSAKNSHTCLWGADQLVEDRSRPVYICAGEWDAIAMRWLLGKLSIPAVVLSLPGEGTFKEEWGEWLSNRDVLTFYDHDDAGRKGEEKAADVLSTARSVTYTHWPTELLNGWDVRDWITHGALHKGVHKPCYDGLMRMQRPYPRLRPSLPPDIERIFQQHTFQRTDTGNAEYVIKRHGMDLRWHRQYKAWMHWNAEHTSWDVLSEPPYHLASAAMRERAMHAVSEGGAEAKHDAAWALGSESRKRMADCLTVARAFTGLQVTVDHWNRNPDVLAVVNGVVDLTTGELREHRRDDYIAFRCPHPYDPDAACPRWLSFLSEVFRRKSLQKVSTEDAAADFIPWIQRAIGYSLTGRTDEHCFFMTYGGGRNGKSTLINTLSHVLGGPSISSENYKQLKPTHPGYAHVLSFSALQKRQHGSEPYELAGLPGRRFVSLAEAEKGAKFNEATLKRWTGGDAISTRMIHQAPITFVPVAKFWLAVNDLPGTDDHSDGFWSRVRVIPFLERFDQDDSLQDALYREAPGILAWAVQGAVEWFRHGLGTNAIVQRATTAYRSESDPLTDLIHETCTEDADATALLKHLNDAYQKWANETDIPVSRRWSRKYLSTLLKQRYTRVPDAGKNKDQIGYVGLAVKERYRLKTVKKETAS